MKQPVILTGIGEVGGVLAKGLLRAGYPVYPATRTVPPGTYLGSVDPFAVIVATAERDFDDAVRSVPEEWRERLILIQNELLPRDWKGYSPGEVTVVSIWFEKKPGADPRVILPSPVYGPRARLVDEALGAVKIPAVVLPGNDELLYELVRKNLYILTTNLAGLVAGGTVSDLRDTHREFMMEVAGEVLDIQDALTDQKNDRERLIRGMLEAFDGDPEHNCTGRSAPDRLRRALLIADREGLAVKVLRKIAAETSN